MKPAPKPALEPFISETIEAFVSVPPKMQARSRSVASKPVVGKIPVRRKFDWLTQVNRDHALPPHAVRVAYEISQLINDASNTAWPSQAYLARTLGLCRRTVQNALNALIEQHHLIIVESGKGRGRANHYRMFIKARIKPEQGSENE
jgi:biotin operon repressor